MKNNKLIGKVIWLLLLIGWLLSGAANAELQITFTPPVEANQIDLFWAVDPMTASDLPVRSVSADPSSSISLTNPSKPDATYSPALPNLMYHFWSGATPVASQTNYVRIWYTTDRARPDDSLYTELSGYANGVTGINKVALALDYRYVKASAGAGKIGSCDEVTTTTFGTTITTARKLVFKAEQPTKIVGTTTAQIQVKQAEWTIAHGTAPATTSSGDTTNPLQLTINDVVAGDTYTATFKYKSYWGDFSTTVDTRSYTVGAGVPGGPGVTSITLVLVSTGMGINQFTLPFVPAYRGVNEIRTIAQLVAQINAAPGGDVVRSVGWWDSAAQIDMGYVVSGTSLTPVNTTLDPATTALETNKAYQITVSGAKTVTLNSTSTP